MYEQYIGKTYNNWTVLEYSHKDSFNHPYFKCICKCGKVQINDIYTMKYGRSKSCPSCAYHKKTHGLSQKRIYSIFYGIKQRCYNPKSKAYKHYGGRGIKICSDWLNNFENFAKWSYENGYDDKLTIDRINYDESYCPENCRWVDMRTQANNRRNNHIITYKNKNYSVADFCRAFGLNEQTTRERINVYGITAPEELLKKPHNLSSKSKIFISLAGKKQSLSEWCNQLGVSYGTIQNRIKKYRYTPEAALTTPLKNGKNNPLLSSLDK